MLGGLFGGAAVGAGAGALIGRVGGLPSDKAEAVNAHLDRIGRDRSLDAQLADAVRAAIAQVEQVDAAQADVTVTARLDRFDLHQHPNDRLSFWLDASMVQTWQPPGEPPKQRACAYRYSAERRDAQAWLADDGAAFRKTLEEGLWTIARWMARDLEAFASQKELPASATEPASCFREARWYRF
jgi:hypothetical protein